MFKDNGNGIPDDLLDKIFDPFFTTKDVNKGTGIGLSLVHNFIEEMNGTLKVESEIKNGATFIITLPTFVKDATSSNTETTDKFLETNSYHGNVLLVDDEEEIRNLLNDILENLGMNVTCAKNGKEAYELFLKNPGQYEVIITDMKMPIMDGPTLIKTIRDNKELSQPGIVLVTGGINDNFEDKNNNLNQLIDGYFYKPFEDDKISEILNNILDDNQKIQLRNFQ